MWGEDADVLGTLVVMVLVVVTAVPELAVLWWSPWVVLGLA